MPPVRKIVVIGPESTGKSTLSADLAAALGTVWAPEYAREYLEGLGRPYTEPDLLEIAKGQLAAEDALLPQAHSFLICDTDLYVIRVWSEARFGRCHPSILESIASRPYDLYLLTGIDIPCREDPLREHPRPEERRYFYELYRDLVQHSGLPWTPVSGNPEQRLAQSLQAISGLRQDI